MHLGDVCVSLLENNGRRTEQTASTSVVSNEENEKENTNSQMQHEGLFTQLSVDLFQEVHFGYLTIYIHNDCGFQIDM